MAETTHSQFDQEIHQLEVETFEIEDLAEIDLVAPEAAGCTSTSSTSCCSSCCSCTSTAGSTAALQPMPARDVR